MKRGARVAVSLGVAIAAGLVAAWKAKTSPEGIQTDFRYYWEAARVLLHGGNPYRGPVPLVYPLPAALVVALVAWLPLYQACALFVALSFGLLCYAILTHEPHQWPLLCSFPALWAVNSGQFTPLVTCAAISGWYGWSMACKPTLGAAMWLRRVDRRGIIIGAAFVAVSLVLAPTWPLDWIAAMRTMWGERLWIIPVALPLGTLLAVAAVRYRDPDARMLLGMALVPQSFFFYDQLPLALIAKTRQQALVWALWTYVVPLLAFLLAPRPLPTTKLASLAVFSGAILYGYYFPALAIVLGRGVWRARPWLRSR